MQPKLLILCVVGMICASTERVGAAENTKDRGAPRSLAAPSDAGTTSSDLTVHGSEELRDLEGGSGTPQKTWQLALSGEFHHLVRQNDLAPGRLPTSSGEGDAANRNVLYYLFTGIWQPTLRDRVTAQWGVYQRFLADDNETGVRSDDGTIAYTRSIWLPGKVLLRIQPRVDLGLSYESVKLSSLIAAPRLGVSAQRDFGPLNIYALVYGYLYLEKYDSYVGGDANPRNSLAALIQATFTVPHLRALEVGVLGTASAVWYHQVRDDGSNTLIRELGSTSDALTPSQPFSNDFGGEIFARYTLPTEVVGSDILIAYANGDPTIGYQALRHDGVGRFNLFYRHVAELYAAVTVRY